MTHRIVGLTGLCLTISTSVLVISIESSRASAQTCSNFWVNPQSGAEECLDALTFPATPARGTAPGVAPSDSANRQALVPQSVTSIRLYDGTLGSFPAQQGWLAYSLLGGASQTLVPGATTLSTSSGVAGYSNHQPLQPVLVNAAFPALNRNHSYRLSFQLSLNRESHSSNDRAGLSLTAISQDLRGIELGFWINRIWAQLQGFTQNPNESVPFPNQTLVSYDLLVTGNSYYLSANNRLILKGSLQDYSAFPATGLPYNPYRTANFLFLGDNTRSADASTTLAKMGVTRPTLGTPQANTLIGSNGNDLINGLGGNDTLRGGPGQDHLIGGDSNDLLGGDQGDDLLLGGPGVDTFLFDTNTAFAAPTLGLDTILDLAANGDVIGLDKTTFTQLRSQVGNGFSRPSEFAQVNSPGAVAGSTALIVYDRSSGGLFYNANGTAPGLGSGGQFAILTGAPSITANTFRIYS